MFDHLVATSTVRTRRVRLHHHVSVFAIVIGVMSTVIALNLNLPRFQTMRLLQAQEPQVTARLVTAVEQVSVVGPLILEPVLTIDATVSGIDANIETMEFILDGAYDRAGIDGLTLYIDGAQVGAPVQPDAHRRVRYQLETTQLSAGVHQFVVKLTTNTALGAARFQAATDPSTLFVLSNATGVRMQLPYRTAGLNVVDHGDLGVFVRTLSPGGSAAGIHELNAVYLYGEAEDFQIQRLVVEADHDLNGARIDVFNGRIFIATAQFIDGQATLDVSESVLRTVRGKNMVLTLLLTPADAAVSSLTLTNLVGIGIQSKYQAALAPQLSLLPNR